MQVRSINLMLTMVAAGLAVGLAGASQIAGHRELNIVTRPLAQPAMLTTWLLRPAHDTRENVARFVQWVSALDTPPTVNRSCH